MSSSKKTEEQDFLHQLAEEIADPKIQLRLKYLFNWYTQKSQHNKRLYNYTRFFTYLIPCVVTVVGIVAVSIEGVWGLYVTTILSTMLIGVNHMIDHFRFYENWVRYRSTAEQLKRHTELFINHCEPYKKASEEENREAFVLSMESVAAAELLSWENLQSESFQSYKAEHRNAKAGSSAGNADPSSFPMPPAP